MHTRMLFPSLKQSLAIKVLFRSNMPTENSAAYSIIYMRRLQCLVFLKKTVNLLGAVLGNLWCFLMNWKL